MQATQSWARYLIAFLGVVGVALLSLAFQPYLVSSRAILFFAVIAISARYGGFGPGIVATALGALAFSYIFLAPVGSLALDVPISLIALIEFLAVGSLIAVLSAELRAAQRRAQANAALLDTIFASAPVGIQYLDRDLRIVRINAAMAEMTGLEAGASIGRALGDALPDLLPIVEPLTQRVLATGSPITGQERTLSIPSRPGEERTWLVNAYPVRVDDRTAAGIGIIVMDITRRKRLELERERLLDRVQMAEARYRALFENLADAVLVEDVNRRCIDANQAATRLLGYSRDELLTISPTDLVRAPSGLPRREAGPLDQQEQWQGEIEVRRKDGTPIPVEARTVPIALPSGLAYVSVLRDVRERKRAEEERARLTREQADREAVERERARLQSILERAPSGIIYIDAATGLIIANQQEAELLGRALEPDAGPSQYVGFLRHPDGRPMTVAELPSTRAMAGESVANEEVVIVRPDGRRIMTMVNAAPVFGPTRAIEGVVVVVQDITALKDLEHLREEFVTAVAHELRSPLAVIKGQAQLAMRSGALEGRVRDSLGAIDRQTGRIAQIVDDLLTVIRVRSGRGTLTLERVDLSALVRDTTTRATRRNPEVRIVVDVVGPLVVDAERLLVDKVVARLLDNALRSSSPGESVTLVARQRDHRAEVAVTHRGVGIPVERQAHVFEPFYELAPPGTPGYTGVVSLGLYVSKQIVDAHGGSIRCSSIPGDVTTFSFSLPLAEGSARTD